MLDESYMNDGVTLLADGSFYLTLYQQPLPQPQLPV
jgi:hypothetical protein